MGFRELAHAHNKLVEQSRQLAEIHKQLAIEHAQTRGAVTQLLVLTQRGFFGRLKWFLFGR